MADEVRLDGLGVAPGVLETIAIQAAGRIDGVVSVDGGKGVAGLVDKAQGRGVEVCPTEAGGLDVSLHVSLAYGKPLHEAARLVQSAVAEALESMTDQRVNTVDVYVDDVVFSE